jgi:magnesium chelatase family protein
MLARVHSFVLVGIDPILCEIEADVSTHGMSRSEIVGLAQNATKESLDRVKRAIVNSGFMFTAHQTLINLAPADVRKEGPSLDLPIAIGLLRGTGGIAGDKHKDYLIAGELALDGRVRKIKGALSLAMLARDKAFRGVIVPAENAREAAVVEGVEVIGVDTLLDTVSFLSDLKEIAPHVLDGRPFAQSQVNSPLDFADVRGQEAVKRVLTIAAAGSHNVFMLSTDLAA